MKAASSRATATTTLFFESPRLVSRLNRPQSRSCAVQAMRRTRSEAGRLLALSFTLTRAGWR